MGVLNVTPDSFSDGGRYLAVTDALARAKQMQQEGAAIIDVGGESTRPGAERVSEETELARVMPVIKELASEGVLVSVDTTRASVAEAAIAAGARMVNDVSGGKSDAAMFAVVAATEVDYVLMHWRAPASEMDSFANYDDVSAEVVNETKTQVDLALAAGIQHSKIVIDPGFGFAKNAEHNWQLLKDLPLFLALGLPVLVGVSRKRFLTAVLPPNTRDDNEAKDLVGATIGAFALANGAWGVRTHDPAGVARALGVMAPSH